MLPFAAKLQKVEGLLEILHALGEGTIFCDLGAPDSDTRISYFVPEKARLGAFHYIKERFGRLDKIGHGNMAAHEDGLTVTLFGVAECRVVGYEDVEVAAEEAVEAHTEKRPVYECLSPLAAAAKE